MKTAKSKITKRSNHDHFWIENGLLYETYKTIRGLRYICICECGDIADSENVNEETIKKIEDYLNN